MGACRLYRRGKFVKPCRECVEFGAHKNASVMLGLRGVALVGDGMHVFPAPVKCVLSLLGLADRRSMALAPFLGRFIDIWLCARCRQ